MGCLPVFSGVLRYPPMPWGNKTDRILTFHANCLQWINEMSNTFSFLENKSKKNAINLPYASLA